MPGLTALGSVQEIHGCSAMGRWHTFTPPMPNQSCQRLQPQPVSALALAPLFECPRRKSSRDIPLTEYSLEAIFPWSGRLSSPTSSAGALYAFDPRRTAILLIGGDKTGDDRWYEVHVPLADRLYEEHLDQLRKEGLIHGQKIR